MLQIEVAKKSAKGSLYLFTGNFFSTVIALVSVIIIARLLGPDGYGTYTVVLIIPSILYLFLGIGVTTAVTRYAAFYSSSGESGSAKRITINAVIFLVLVGTALTVLAYFSAGFLSSTLIHREGSTDLVRLAILLVFAQAVYQSGVAGLIGWNSMGVVSIAATLQSILKVGIIVVLLLLGFGVVGAIAGYLMSVLFSGGLATFVLFVIRIRLVASKGGQFLSDVREMLAFGLPVYVGGLLLGFTGQYLYVILAAIAADVVIGYYQAALNVALGLNFMLSAITLTLLPAFASLESAGGDTGLALKYAVKYTSFLIGPTAFYVIGAARPLMEIIYGASYLPSVSFLQLLALSNLPLLLGSAVIPSYFNALGRTRLSMFVQIVYAASLLGAATFLSFGVGLGVVGVILSQLLSNLTFALSAVLLSNKVLRTKIDLRSIGIVLASSAASLGTLVLVGRVGMNLVPELVVGTSAFVLVYLTLAPLLGAVDGQDLTRLEIAVSDLGTVKSLLKPVFAFERKVLSLKAAQLGERRPIDDFAR